MRHYLVLVLVGCSGGSAHPGDATPDIAVGCGDGVKSATEACDGADLGGATCATATAAGWVGVVSCTRDCQLDIAGCSVPQTTWNPITEAANWSAFDLTTLFPGAKGFESSVFDGRYLYLIPNSNGAADGIVARYDTQAALGASASWTTFDVSTVEPLAKGFAGAAFDGRYIYLAPYNNGAYDGVTARYDTQGGFGDAAAWSTFDIATVDANAVGYQRAAFDGRYLYYAPHYNGAYHGNVARYDTQGDFATASSWSTFDASTIDARSKGFLGVEFDGRYLYLIPYYDGTAYEGVVTRYDTTADFATAASWSTFNVAGVNGNAVGFWGTAFDGRYLYMAQYYDGVAAVPNYGGFIARYDTQADFATDASWEIFDATTINGGARGFIGAGFDGRFIYFAPYYDNTAYDGLVARFDSQGSGFGDAASWDTFDVATLNPGAKGYKGVGFDGQNVYLIPAYNGAAQGIVTRFTAKSPSWMPRGWSYAFD